MLSDLMNFSSSVMKRPTPISLKLGRDKIKIGEVLVIGDSHVKKMGDSMRAGQNFKFSGVGGAQAHDWSRHFRDILEQSSAEVVIVQLGGNDVSQHPKKQYNDQLPIGNTAQALLELMKFGKTLGKDILLMEVISRRNEKVHAEAISMLNKRLREQRKNYYIPIVLDDWFFAKDNVLLTPGCYDDVVECINDFVFVKYWFG